MADILPTKTVGNPFDELDDPAEAARQRTISSMPIPPTGLEGFGPSTVPEEVKRKASGQLQNVNPFDRFDKKDDGKNPFDAFDLPKSAEARDEQMTTAAKNMGSSLLKGVKAIPDALGAISNTMIEPMPAFMAGLVATPLHQLSEAIKGNKTPSFEEEFKNFQENWASRKKAGEANLASHGVPPMPKSPTQEDIEDWINENVMRHLPAVAGMGHLPQGMDVLAQKRLAAAKTSGRAAMENEFQGPQQPYVSALDQKLNALRPQTPVAPQEGGTQGELFGNDQFPYSEQQIAESKAAESGQMDLFGPQNVPSAGMGGSPMESMIPQKAMEARQAELGQRIPGDNTPMDLPESPYPVSAEDHPAVLQDAPYPHQDSLDFTDHTADVMSKPLEQETPRTPPELSAWEGEGGNTAITGTGNSGPAAKSAAYWRNRQRGAIDISGIHDAIDAFKRGVASGHKILAAYKGAFNPDEMDFMKRAIDNPGNRNAVVLLSPDEFHSLAAGRSADYLSGKEFSLASMDFGPERLRQSIREGLKSPKGLDEVPTLMTRTKDGIAQVFGHEGRHRMDVFKEMGIDKVPVLIRDATQPWGKAERLRGEDEYEEGFSTEPKEARPFPPILNNKLRVPRSQRGAIDPELLGSKLSEMLGKAMEKMRGVKVDPLSPQERKVVDNTGVEHIPKGDAPDAIVAKALAEGKDGEKLWTLMQSGLQNAAEKVNSALMGGVARWLSWADKVGDNSYANKVRPIERMYKKLSSKDLVDAQGVLRNEMMNKREYTPDELMQIGLSAKAVEAHIALRKAMTEVLDHTNETLVALGKKPISRENAYMASMWDGNWHIPIKDNAGKLAWYIKTDTKAEALQAINHLRNDPEFSKTLQLDKLAPEYKPQNIGSRVPRDVIGAYQDMLQFFDGATAEHMEAAMKAYVQEQGYKFQQHKMHFENKVGVRGFLGDRPWLSPEKNAMSQAKAQVRYLKDAYQWAPMQEALANVKQVLAHPELNKMQPNNMELTKAYVSQALGLSNNMLKVPENALQKLTTSMPVGAKAGNLGRFVSQLKTMTYLQQLGLSGGYMIATPLQAFLLGPSWHLKLSGEGFGHSALMTSLRALNDFSVGLTHSPTPMSAIGKRAFAYMEANGIISQNIFHENAGLGENAVVHGIKQTIGWTISMPEKIARAATFMSFVHHLNASGKLPEAALFQKAEELTNHVLTDFRRMSRPLLVDRFGQAGELAYVYKSPLFNQYNNLGIFVRDAQKGDPKPLLAALGMSAILGGLTTMPLVNEVDKAFDLLKLAVAETWPEAYHHVAGVGVKGTIIQHMAELSANDKVQAAIGPKAAKFLGDMGAFGAPSVATGSQLSSRFSSSIGDISNPLGDVAPVAQELKEWIGAGHAITNPNSTTIEQGIHSAVAPPIVKGLMENNLDGFKTVKQEGGQGYANPNHIEEHKTTYVRTPDEEMKRNFGLTSLEESTTKQSRYINQIEDVRLKKAQEVSIDKMFDAIHRDDKPDTIKYARSFVDNNGNPDNLNAELDKKLDTYMFTPEQRAAIHAQTISALKSVKRMRGLQGKDNAN